MSLKIYVFQDDDSPLILQVKSTDTVSKLKELLADWTGIPPEEQQIQIGQKTDDDDKTLEGCGINADTNTVELRQRKSRSAEVFKSEHRSINNNAKKKQNVSGFAHL